MDIRTWGQKLPPLVKKYRYAILVLAVGLVLMLLPTGTKTAQLPQQSTTEQEQTVDPAQELSQILCQIQGVGKVQVLLTVKAGQSTIYQTDEDITTSDTSSSIRKETVIITDSQRNESALVVQVLPPEYLGAVIVCQGADNAAVRLAVVEAVSRATGLGADRISVLKMK